MTQTFYGVLTFRGNWASLEELLILLLKLSSPLFLDSFSSITHHPTLSSPSLLPPPRPPPPNTLYTPTHPRSVSQSKKAKV